MTLGEQIAYLEGQMSVLWHQLSGCADMSAPDYKELRTRFDDIAAERATLVLRRE